MNKKYLVLAAALIIALACAAGAIYIISDDDDKSVSSSSGESYSITYVLNGGINSDLNMDSYQSGNEYKIYNPTSDEMYFYAWYLDENFENECNKITPDMQGDLTLYVRWADNLEGKGISFMVSGCVKAGFFTEYEMTGVENYMYLYYDQEADRYFMSNTSEYVYSSGFLKETKDYESTYWSDESDIIWTYAGETTIDTINGEKLCEVWQGTDAQGTFVQTQYIGDEWIPYIMTYESKTTRSTTYLEYIFAGDFTFEASDEYNVQVYCDAGIIVSGNGKYNPGEIVILTASVEEGTEFQGWYDAAGNLLSSDLSYEFEIVAADVVVYAINNTDPDFTYESGHEIEFNNGINIGSASSKIVDIDSGETIAEFSGSSFAYTFDTAGEYAVYITGEYDGSAYYGYCTIIVTGDIARSYEWSFEGKTYTYDLNIEYADLLYYRNLYSTEERQQGTASHDRSFVTSNDEYIVQIAADFKKMTSGMDDLQVAGFILKFIQSLDYQADDVYMGYEEYWKFPLETLFDLGGDCEDTSILYCAIADAMGYDTALLLLPGHMAAGISVDDCKGFGFTTWLNTYYYCETTSDGYDVGENPNTQLYNGRTVTLITI